MDQERAKQKEIGVLERIRALDELAIGNPVLFAGIWLVRLLFILLDMLPVLVKYLSGETAYDRMLTGESNSAVKIHSEEVRLAERRALANLEIAQDAIEQEVRRHRAESEAALREHTAAMNIRVRQAVKALEDDIRRAADGKSAVMTTPRGEADPDTGTGTSTDRGAELARVLLSETREELVRADNKAGLMLASLGASLAALLGAIGSGVIAPRQYPVVPQLLLWAGCVACVPALVLLGLAVTPRLGNPRHSQAHYFGETRRALSVAQLEQTVRRTDPVSRDLSQLGTLSQIAWTKYRCIRHALAWAAAFVALTLLGIVTGAST